MSCTDNIHEMDKSQNFLFPFAIPEKLKKLPTKTSSRDDELSAKANLWRILTNQRPYGVCNTNNFPKQDKFTLEEKAWIFVQSVAGGLLEKIGRKSKNFFLKKKKKKIFLGNMEEQKKNYSYCNIDSYNNRLIQKC